MNAAKTDNSPMDKALRQGLADIEGGRFETAHAAAIERIRANVHDPVPYYLLAQIALHHKNFVKADELFVRAQALAPKELLYAAAYAQYLVTVGRQAEALECADAAALLSPGDAWATNTLGVVYSRTGFHEKAVPFFERAVEQKPADANYQYNLGAALQFAGDFPGAEAAYNRALEEQPEFYRAWSSLIGLRKQTGDANHLQMLDSLFTTHEADPDAALHFGHAMAKSLEDIGHCEESFDWLVRAKRGKRAALDYDVRSDLDIFAAARRTIGRGEAADASIDAAPIFIVGLPRTGTTLVDRILSSHPDVVAAGELNTFAGLIKSATATSSNRVLDPETLTRAAAIDLSGLGQAYVDKTRKLTRGAARFTDKMPLNFFYAALIQRALPNARIVALRRDALDSCLSNFRQLFSTGFSYYNYALDISDTAAYYKAFDGLMHHWQEHLPAENFIELRYEDVVHDQEAQTRRLLQFCGLTWHEACLRFHENAAPVSTASSVQVRQPLYSGSIGRWEKYGDRMDGLKQRLGLAD